MIRVLARVDTGWAGCWEEEEFEFEDGTTEEEIRDYVAEWGNEIVEVHTSFEILSQGEGEEGDEDE